MKEATRTSLKVGRSKMLINQESVPNEAHTDLTRENLSCQKNKSTKINLQLKGNGGRQASLKWQRNGELKAKQGPRNLLKLLIAKQRSNT